jgi:hypothetical protein
MQRIKEIIARLKTIGVHQAAIENDGDAQNIGVTSPELRTKYDAPQAGYDRLKTEKAALEKEAKKRQARANRAVEDFARKGGATEDAIPKYWRGTDVPRLDRWPASPGLCG